MITLLSPAKDLNMTPVKGVKGTQPLFLEQSAELHARLKGLSARKLEKLMGISGKLAELNHQRYQDWAPPFTAKNAKPAVLSFNGEAYRGLDAASLSAEDLAFAQHHLRILSGLYGVLRPLDLMQAYRLEMGTRLSMGRGRKDLYAFWGDRLTEQLNADLEANESDVVVNLASQEYFKAVRPAGLRANVITPVFKDKVPGGYRMLMVFAKHQRGAMARHIITHRIMEPVQLKRYTGDGYRYSPEESTASEWVFLRDKR